MRLNRMAAAAAVGVLVVGVAGYPAATAAPGAPGDPRYTDGASGVGDDYFPYSGNSGYDVQHYDLALHYTPPTADGPLEGYLKGVATIDLVATADLSSLNFDLRGLDVTGVRVNGKAVPGSRPGAATTRPGYWQVQDDAERRWELTVRTAPKLQRGDDATVVIEYEGATGRPTDIEDALYGWVTTRDGAIVANEPDGAMTWYPVNDHPTDKATYSFAIDVPEGTTAVANGVPAGDPVTRDGRTTWFWDAPDAMASYLSTASIGNFEQRPVRQSASGVPIYDFVDRDITGPELATTNASLSRQQEMIDFFESTFGPYPFNSYGSIVDDDSLGYALETQTRPVYSGSASESTVAHELSHQWFGNAVSPQAWQHICLNEGWATYSTWLWNEHRGIRTAQQSFDLWYAPARTPAYWELPIGDPGPYGLFASQVYNRGAATLHALRGKVGDDDFFAASRLWLSRYDDATGTTADFQAVFEEVSGQDLDDFFGIWLFDPAKPTGW